MTANRNIVGSNDSVEKAQAHLYKLVEQGQECLSGNNKDIIKAMQAIVKAANQNSYYAVKSKSPIYTDIIKLFATAKEKFKQAEWLDEIRLQQALFFEKTMETEKSFAIYKSIKNKPDSPYRLKATEAHMNLCEWLGKDDDSLASAEEIVNADESSNIKPTRKCLRAARNIIFFRSQSPDFINEESDPDPYLSKSAPAILK